MLRWMGALSSTERCDKLLARRVARDEGAVQAGVPISFIAMLGGLAPATMPFTTRRML